MAARRKHDSTSAANGRHSSDAMNGNIKAEDGGPAAKSAKRDVSKVATVFESLDYGPAPESGEIAKKWIASHDGLLGHFINGKWVKPDGRKRYDSFSPATGNFSCCFH